MLKGFADAVPKTASGVKSSGKAHDKDPIAVILARALGDDGGAVRGSHGFQLWAATQPVMLEACKIETAKVPVKDRNGFRTKYWEGEFAKQPDDVRATFHAQAAASIQEAKASRAQRFQQMTEAPSLFLASGSS